jgi:serine/threonine protein phosphatase PrpC
MIPFSSLLSLTNMDSFTIQTGSQQDYSGHAHVQNTSYCFVFDGHGTNDCIDAIRLLDMNQIALTESPPHAIQQLLQPTRTSSGATFVLARITENTLEVFHVGDAKAKIFINGRMVHETKDHTFLNPREIERTKDFVSIQNVKVPFPVSDTEVKMVDSPMGYFNNGTKLVPSQALGHNGITGLAPGHFIHTFDIFDHVRVVCGSDGFWDMLPPTEGKAQALAEEAVRRWKQKWLFQGEKTDYGGSYDDVSVAILDNQVAIPPTVCIPYSIPCFTEEHVRYAFPLPIHKVDEVCVGNHKLFFLHLHLLQDHSFLKDMHRKQVKLYWDDDWFWHLKLRGTFTLLPQEFIDLGLSLEHYENYIPAASITKIVTFLHSI